MREEKQKCFNKLPVEIQKMVTLVTHSGRADLLRQYNPTANIIDLGVTDGIADVRQKILDQSPDDHVMIIDDQCRFKKRNSSMKYDKMTPEQFVEMFELVESHLKNYAMVGICDRPGNNRILTDTKSPARMYSVYAINRKMWRENGIRFDGMYQKNKEIRLYEDFYAVLSMLTRGMPNLLLCNYIFESEHGIKGGNSTVRNNDLQKKCIEALITEFPDFVKMTRAENVSWSTDSHNGGDRWEVRVRWKEAFESSSKKSTETSLDDFFS
jgi:hypothetical protein